MFPPKVMEIIDKLEKICRAFFNPRYSVRNLRIEKCRWNNPIVEVSYQPKESLLYRSINVLVQGEDGGIYLSFDGNVWVDDESTLTRRWLNRSSSIGHSACIGTLSDIELAVLVATTLQEMFDSLNNIKEDQLVVNVSKLRPFPK